MTACCTIEILEKKSNISMVLQTVIIDAYGAWSFLDFYGNFPELKEYLQYIDARSRKMKMIA